MYQNKLSIVEEKISSLDVDIGSNQDIFSLIKDLQNTISDIEKSKASYRKITQKQIISDLNAVSSELTHKLYQVLVQYMEKHILSVDVLLHFLIKHPYLLVEDINEKKSHFLELNDVCWRLLIDVYVDSSSPEVFAELCKNNNVLTHKQIISLFTTIIDRFIFEVTKKILKEVGDWDNETKHILTQKIRTQYPKASKKMDHILLGKNKRNTIQQDFLLISKKSFCGLLNDEISKISEADFYNLDFHQIVSEVSINLMLVSDHESVNHMFFTYVSLFLEEQFQKSNHNNIIRQENKPRSIQNMIASALTPSQNSPIKLKDLPNGLKDDINTYLQHKNINGDCEKISNGIEKILQKFFTKNNDIRKKRFKEKIISYGADCIDDDFFVILEKYNFVCIDDDKSILDSEELSKIDIVECPEIMPTNNVEPFSDENNILLTSLDVFDIPRLKSESKSEYFTKKMCGYTHIFEQMGYIFDNKEKFIETASAHCLSNIRLDKEFKKVICDIIMKNKKEQKKRGRDYYTFEMANGWRILLYKKGVISSIGPHDFYEKHIKNNY
ncbi:MAG: hypothetical protein WC010_01275 [Candidatus Absconditabacterales bacterium]